jgi:Tfp pilus assembly protein PilZ
MERKKQRFRVSFGRPGEPLDRMGYTEDVSPFGLFVSTRKNPEVGEEIWIELELSGEKVVLRGTVAWRRSTARELRSVASSGFGFQIVNAPEEWFRLF